jgi:hypothetical protein
MIKEIKGEIEKKRKKIDLAEYRKLAGLLELVEAAIHYSKSRLTDVEKAYRRAINLFKFSPEADYEEMEARWCLADFLQRQAAKSEREQQAELFCGALEEARALVQKYPFFGPGQQAIIGPLVSLDRGDEAIEHARWLIRNLYSLTLDVFANLIILSTRAGLIRFEALSLLTELQEKIGEARFKQLLELSIKLTGIAFKLETK